MPLLANASAYCSLRAFCGRGAKSSGPFAAMMRFVINEGLGKQDLPPGPFLLPIAPVRYGRG
jgi:hypothetical protein